MANHRQCCRVKGYIDLIRPFTLLAPLLVSTCIIFASYFSNDISLNLASVWWTIILPASISLALLNGASNTLNQITDIDTDKLSKQYRPLPRGTITTHEAYVVALIMYTSAFLLAAMVHPLFVGFILFITFFTLTYSLRPRLKDVLIFNQLWVAIPRGFLGVLASWCVFGDCFQPVPLIIGVIALLFLVGGSITKDITDSDADKQTGTHTLVNTFGIKKAALFSFPFLFFPFVCIPLLISAELLPQSLWLLTFLAIPGYLVFYCMVKDRTKGRFLENTSAWAVMYLTYFVFASSFSILTIIDSVIL